ncbi:MAG: hypothetical protein HC880_12535 [Bacteroidia bacterium]|nr:hypothetical protein [Bacteroidia bacterium]
MNENDRTYLGKTIPGYLYGIQLSLEWKGMDFLIFMQGVGDVQKFNLGRLWLENTATRGNNMLTTVLDSWTPDNPNASMPRAVVNDPSGNTRPSSRFVESAAYLRLASLQLGYVIPARCYAFARPYIQYIRMYGAVNNALTFTAWSGLDPENDFSPPPRILSVGLQARF